MPVAVEWAIVAQSHMSDSRHDEEGTHKGGLARAECQMLSEVRRVPTRGLEDQCLSETRTTVV